MEKIRTECLELLKEAKGRQSVIDILKLYNTNIITELNRIASNYIDDDCVLLGLGSLSRQMLSPFSDLDLLLLCNAEYLKDEPPEKIKKLVYKFYDMNFNISVSTRTISETLSLMKESHKTFFSVLSPLYIAGSRQIFDDFEWSKNKKLEQIRLLKKTFKDLQNDSKIRRIKNRNDVIPNVKENPGAFREAFLCLMLFPLVRDEFGEYKKRIEKLIEGSIEDIYIVRSLLHSAAGRQQEILSESFYGYIADILNMDIEILRKDLILKVREIFVIYRAILSVFDKDKYWQKILIKRHFSSETRNKNILDFLIPKENVYLKYWTREIFNEIPEFKMLEGYSDKIGIHIYPVDKHTVYAINYFYKLLDKNVKGEPEFIRNIAVSLDQKQRETLLIAILLHDIGKGRGGNHHIKGKKIAEEILSSYSYNESETAVIIQLIENHLLIYNATTRQDIEDPEVLNSLVSKIDGISNLEMLILLAYCDLKATNPTSLSRWNVDLMEILYRRLRSLIEGTVYTLDPKKLKQWAIDNKKQISDEMLELISLLPSPYLKFHNHLEVYDTVTLLYEMKKGVGIKLKYEFKENSEYGRLAIAMPEDKKGIFHRITLVLSEYGANIIYSSMHSMKNGWAYDIFRIGGSIVHDDKRLLRMLAKLESELNKDFKSTDFSFSPGKKRHLKPRLDYIHDHAKYTQVEIECRDRNKLLVDLSALFLSLDLNVTFAKISTFGKNAVDTFHLSKNGLSLDAEVKEELRKKAAEIL